MTTLARIRRILSESGPFPSRLKRPTRIPVTVIGCDETAVLVEIELVTGPHQGWVAPSALLDLPTVGQRGAL
jgi:hypothetical protein